MFRKTRKSKKIGGITFFFTIPLTYIASIVCLVALGSLSEIVDFEKNVWGAFAVGGVFSFALFFNMGINRFTVFLHETKHAATVILTGNYLTHFHVASKTGHVNYLIRPSKFSTGPLIALAPYYFPLISAPMLIGCIFAPEEYRTSLSFFLGITLGADLATAIRDYRPWQTDLTNLRGSFVTSAAFVFGANLFWICFCLLWVSAGNEGFQFAWFVTKQLADPYLAEFSMKKFQQMLMFNK